MKQEMTVGKTCGLCGADCTNRPRTRDPQGHYYCTDCYELARAACHRRANVQALAEATTVADTNTRATPSPDVIADTIDAAADTLGRCPSCGEPKVHAAVICTDCGYDMRTASCVQIEDPALSRAPAALAPSTKWGDILERQGAETARAARMDLVKPLVLVAVGLGATIALLGSVIADTGLVVLGVYLVGLSIEVGVGVVALWISARLWLGGAGPLGLAILRLAGIYAIVDALALAVAPFLIAGWLIRLIVYLGLISWLFELDWRDSAMLGIITFTLKIAAGFAMMTLVF